MADPTSPPIGERVRYYRTARTPKMTQEELAARAGISVDLVRKLERGERTPRVTTLHRVAAALDVDVAALLTRTGRIDTATEDTRGGIVAIRGAIVSGDSDGEPGEVAQLAEDLGHGWRAMSACRWEHVGAMVPSLLAAARATAAGTGEAAAHKVVAGTYHLAANVLTLLGHADLGYLAMDRACDAAEAAGDEVLHATLRGWQSWVLVHVTGGAAQAARLAVATADATAALHGDGAALPARMARGDLLVHAAVAAVRDEDVGQADDLLDDAAARARELPAEEVAARQWATRRFGTPWVVMQQVDGAVVSGRPGRALECAATMPPEGERELLPLAWARHRCDVAAAHAQLGHDREALLALLGIERDNPAWMTYQPYPRAVVTELLERERQRNTALRNLAARLGVA